MSDELLRFVRHAREKGMSLADIRALLTAAGWKDRPITEAFGRGELDLPVPEPPGASSTRDVFLHLLAFTALYTWVVSFVMLWFAYVDIAFPDPAWRVSDTWREMRESSIRAGLASIVVAYPAFLVLWGLLLGDIRRHPEKAHAAVRRWLTYLSLFVGAVTIAADLITLVYFLFEGEISVRFLLKVVVLFAVTGTGLLYLRLTLRAPPEAGP